jgi:hypothetical protein
MRNRFWRVPAGIQIGKVAMRFWKALIYRNVALPASHATVALDDAFPAADSPGRHRTKHALTILSLLAEEH